MIIEQCNQSLVREDASFGLTIFFQQLYPFNPNNKELSGDFHSPNPNTGWGRAHAFVRAASPEEKDVIVGRIIDWLGALEAACVCGEARVALVRPIADRILNGEIKAGTLDLGVYRVPCITPEKDVEEIGKHVYQFGFNGRLERTVQKEGKPVTIVSFFSQ